MFWRCFREARLMVFIMQNTKRMCHTPFGLFIILKRKRDPPPLPGLWGPAAAPLRFVTLYRVPVCQTAPCWLGNRGFNSRQSASRLQGCACLWQAVCLPNFLSRTDGDSPRQNVWANPATAERRVRQSIDSDGALVCSA